MKKYLVSMFVLFLASPALAEGVNDVLDQTEVDRKLAENPDLGKIEQAVRKRSEERERQRRKEGLPPDQRGDNEPIEDGALEQIVARLPNSLSFLEDIKQEAAREKGQMVEENIWSAVMAKASPDARTTYLNYLRLVYFQCNRFTMLGNYICQGLEKPRGWMGFPTIHHGPVPKGADATYKGGDITLGPGGDAMVVVDHEHWHHMGKPDDGPDSAYVHMGTSYTGSGSSPPVGNEDGWDFGPSLDRCQETRPQSTAPSSLPWFPMGIK